jgi:hypothetical protein
LKDILRGKPKYTHLKNMSFGQNIKEKLLNFYLGKNLSHKRGQLNAYR